MESNIITSKTHGFGRLLGTVLVWTLRIVRLSLFLALCLLRAPIVFFCRIISGPALLFCLLMTYAFPSEHALVRTLGILSFLTFLAVFGYDFVLMKLAPKRMA